MSEEDDAPVGYRNPPRRHRIQQGEVRNPYGRKGKPREEVDFLDAPFTLKLDGKVQTVTRDEALDHALFKEGIAGNVSAIKRLEERRRARALRAEAVFKDERLASEDQRALERCFDRTLLERATSKSTTDAHPPQAGAAGKPR